MAGLMVDLRTDFCRLGIAERMAVMFSDNWVSVCESLTAIV